VAPSPTRLGPYRKVERAPGIPFVAQVVLVLAVVSLGLTVLWVGSGGIGPLVANLASAFGGVIDDASKTAAPSRTPVAAVPDAPLITAPAEPFTNLPTVDVPVSLPSGVVGKTGFRVKLYVTVGEAAPVAVGSIKVGPTAQVTLLGTPLQDGRNAFYATIVGPSGESDPSPVVVWVLDQKAPTVVLSAPKNGAAVTNDAVSVKGKTQGRSTVVARNEANGATATTTAGSDGLFELVIAVGPGVNGITVTSTDPAGNSGSAIVSVRKGSGALAAKLTAAAYRFSVAKLPVTVEFVVTVTDPAGRPLSGARALFTITVPGLAAIISSELTTAGDGTAVFRTLIPSGTQVGSGLASVLVTSDEYGVVTDRQVLTIVK
jgi:hypothetical protein